MKQTEQQHGCVRCGEVNKGYIGNDYDRKLCNECGGIVLNLQEAFDYILSLKAEIDSQDNYYYNNSDLDEE